ncbi:U3 small nucleolar RNA-associated protein 20, partial [Magnaporthiopsis poae ATCC 64411]
MLCVLIPKMVESGALPSTGAGEGFLLPQPWQDQVVSKFERLEITPFPERGAYDKDPKIWRDKCLPKYSALLGILESTNIQRSTSERIAELLLRKLKLSLRPSPSVATDEAHFILTSGFRAYLRMSQDTEELDMSLKPLLRAAAPRFCRLPGFLQNLLAYETELARRRQESSQRSSERESPDTDEDPFVKALVGNLSTNSHELRLVSLRILNQLSPAAHDSSSTLAIMLQAEETPLDLQNLRTISLYLRKLGKIYAGVDQSSWLRKAVPAFLMGMMTVRLTPVWDDAVEALKDIAETKDGEDIIAVITFGWLDIPSQRWSGPPKPILQPTSRRLTDFECSNLSRLQEKSEETKNIVDELFEVMLRAFEDAQTTVPDVTETARSKALKVFTAIPSIAERRSRKLVPHLFSWNDVDHAHADESDDNGQHQAEGKSWSLVDRKALIGVFALFQNPRVLYQNQQVFDVLLNLVANGDIEVQKLALKAILAWKQEGVKRYQENLQGLLEEARLRNELTLLFQGDNKIRDADRPELMPVLLRLLYGRTISKKGAASGRAGVQGTRHAVIRSLSVQDIGGFLEIALGPIHGLRVVDSTGLCNKVFDQHSIPARKQVGLLNMLETIITELGSSVLEYMDPLVNSVLHCLIPACRRLQADREKKLRTSSDEEENGGEEEDGDGNDENEASLLRAARTTALKCFCALLKNAAGFDWTPYQGPIVSEVVSPQTATLAQETTQGVSWTMRLLETWSLMPRCVMALSIDPGVIPAVVQCITIPHTKAEVKIFALGIVRNLIRLSLAPTEESEFNELIRAEILDPNLDLVLGEIGRLLIVDKSKTSDEESPKKAAAAGKPSTAATPPVDEGDEENTATDERVNEKETPEEEAEDSEVVLKLAPISRQLLEAAVDTVVEIAPLVENSKNTRNLVEISTFLLNQPARSVNPKVKGAILLILERFVVLESLRDDAKLHRDLYETICSLFSFFKDRQNRQSLSRLLLVFATQEPAIQEVADLSSQLNSFAEGRLDEPDYDRRLAAFRAICKPRDVPFTIEQWVPLLHNFICYMHHDEEHAILSQNSADGICQFIEAAASVWDQLSSRKQFADRLDRILLPAIYAGAREKSETVRREFVRVMGFLTSHLRSWEPVADLVPLIPEADEADETMEETQQSKKKRDLDFFYNILTPAVSKQVQALQFLQGVNERTSLSSRNVSKFFIPLLEHFVLGREDGSDDQGLGAQATNTISSLAGALEWPQYRALLRRYVLYVKSKPELHKQIIRLLDKVVEALEVVAGQAYKLEITDGEAAVCPSTSTLGKRLPSREKFSDEVSGPLMATLLDHLHEKDETTVSSRVPIGVIIVKLLNLLPANVRDLKLPGVLTDICHILRSKAWDSREMARSTLVKIACILGAPCFGFILKELRGALTRGYQLHVLSYTVHSILVAVIPEFKQGDLDYCVDQVVAVIMDDIFGVTGQEKEAEEYTNKMKEVKSSKSQDSMELIAKNTSISCLITLVQPLKDLLLEKLNLRMARKIDELLSRVTAGLLHNPAAESKDTLIFCYEVIQEVYNSKKPEAEVKLDPRLKRYLIQKGAKKNDRGTTTKHTYKLIRFALDVLRSLMRKHDSLRTASYASGFLPILGDAVIAGEEEVKVAAFKLLVVLVKVPFKNNDSANLYKVALKEALRTISGSTTTTSEVAQAALRLISVILRDRSDVPVKDAAI